MVTHPIEENKSFTASSRTMGTIFCSSFQISFVYFCQHELTNNCMDLSMTDNQNDVKLVRTLSNIGNNKSKNK